MGGYMLSDPRAEISRCRVSRVAALQPYPETQVAAPGVLDERPPHGGGESVADQKAPHPVRTFVQVTHRQIGQHCLRILRAAGPDGAMREEGVVTPGVAVVELLRAQMLGPEYHVAGVIAVPVTVQDAAFGLQLAKERRTGIGREDMECGAFEAVVLDPVNRAPAHVRLVVI